MLHVALLIASLAHADDSVSLTTLERWRAELTGPIEAATGRTFIDRPPLRIVTVSTLLDRLRQLRRAGINTILPSEIPLGLYLHHTQEVFFPVEKWQGMFQTSRVQPQLLEPVVRCVLAHELTHALQHQYVPMAHGSEPDADLAYALREGHADHVASQVCGNGRPWLDIFQGLDVPASRPPEEDLAFRYGYAETFVRSLERVAGGDAAWAVLAHPPERALVTRVGAADLPPGWLDPARLERAGRAVKDADGWTVEATPVSPTLLLGPMAPPKDTEGATEEPPLLPAVAGLQWMASVGDHRVGALAFLLEDEADARAWLARRRASTRTGSVWTLFRAAYHYEGQPAVRRLTSLAKRPGVSDSFGLRLKAAGDWEYHEAWVTSGRQLLGAVIFDASPDPEGVERGLTALLDLQLVEAAPGLTPADEAALAALKPSTPVPHTSSWTYSFDEQLPAILREDWPACVAGLLASRARVSVEDQQNLTAAAVVCAVRGQDTATADALAAEAGGVSTRGYAVALEYAAMLYNAGRYKEALAALPTGPGPLDQVLHARDAADGTANIAVAANAAQGQWAEVERLCADPDVPARVRLVGASALAAAGKTAAARKVLTATCPSLEGEARVACEDTLAKLPKR